MKLTGGMCDRKVPGVVNGKMLQTMIRPVLMYSMATVAVSKGGGDEVLAGEELIG